MEISLIIYLTIIIEIILIIGRLIFGSKKEFLRKRKINLHIHHMYYGFALFVVAAIAFYHELLVIIGAALIFSDLIHHFIVLPIWVGKTEFP